MKLGNLEITGDLVLAPMAGVTDLAFRTICAELGAAVTVTEMVSSRALIYQDKKSRSLLHKTPLGVCGAQIFGNDPSVMADGAALALPLGILVERLCEPGTDMGMGKAIATPAFMFLGVEDPLTGEWVHPVFYYEAAVAGILFVVLLICALRRKKTAGSLLGIFTVLFAATQIFFECMRNDNHMVVHFVPVQQVAELLMLLTVLGCWTKRLAKKGTKKSQIMLIWLVVIACVVLTVFMEFRIDRGSMKLLYYSVIALCMTVVCVLAQGGVRQDYFRLAQSFLQPLQLSRQSSSPRSSRGCTPFAALPSG